MTKRGLRILKQIQASVEADIRRRRLESVRRSCILAGCSAPAMKAYRYCRQHEPTLENEREKKKIAARRGREQNFDLAVLRAVKMCRCDHKLDIHRDGGRCQGTKAVAVMYEGRAFEKMEQCPCETFILMGETPLYKEPHLKVVKASFDLSREPARATRSRRA